MQANEEQTNVTKLHANGEKVIQMHNTMSSKGAQQQSNDIESSKADTTWNKALDIAGPPSEEQGHKIQIKAQDCQATEPKLPDE